MNLEKVFKNGDMVNNQEVVVMDKLREDNPELFNEDGGMDWRKFETEIRPFKSVYVRHDKNSISFTMEDEERGIKGCSLKDIMAAVVKIAEKTNQNTGKCGCRDCKCKKGE